jgi:GNAT superfamily N-acetyltransferase
MHFVTHTPEFSFSVALSTDFEKVYEFHRREGKTQKIWLRSEEQFRALVMGGNAFRVQHEASGNVVGLCYLMPEGSSWELGGLLVSANVRGFGIGTLLVRLVLVYVLSTLEIWKYAQQLISHVHESNTDPRGIFEKVGFECIRRVKVSGAQASGAPEHMRNEAGDVIGHEFRWTPRGVRELADWLKRFEVNSGLKGKPVRIDFAFPFEAYVEAVNEIATEFYDCL